MIHKGHKAHKGGGLLPPWVLLWQKRPYLFFFRVWIFLMSETSFMLKYLVQSHFTVSISTILQTGQDRAARS